MEPLIIHYYVTREIYFSHIHNDIISVKPILKKNNLLTGFLGVSIFIRLFSKLLV